MRDALASGGEELTAEPDGGSPIRLRLDLLPRDREIVLAGGLHRALSQQPAHAQGGAS